MPNQEDVLRRVFAKVKQLVDCPIEGSADIGDAVRYHTLSNQLDALGFDISDFRFDLKRDMFINFWNDREMRADVFNRQVRALSLYFKIREKSVRFAGPTQDES
jgi:hypothetical protein